MSLPNYLDRLREKIAVWMKRHYRLRQRQLKVVRLEDRRLPDASFALVGTVLHLDGFAANASLEIQSVGDEFQFDLTGDQWDASLLPDPNFDISGLTSLQTLAGGTITSISIGSATTEIGDVLNGAGKLTVGALSIQSSGTVTLDHVENDFGTVSIVATGDVTLHDTNDLSIDVINSGLNDISITVDDAISETGDAGVDLIGNNVVLQATTGIGAADSLETNITTFSASTSGADADIDITEINDVSILSVSASLTSDIRITASGSILDGDSIGSDNVDLQAGNVELIADNGHIGATGASVFTLDVNSLEVDSTSGVANAVNGAVAISGPGSAGYLVSAEIQVVKFTSDGNISDADLFADNVVILSEGFDLTIADALSVTGDLRIEADDLVGPLNFTADRLSLSSLQTESLSSTVNSLDAEIGGNFSVFNSGALALADLDGDGFALQIAGGGTIAATSPLLITANASFAATTSLTASNSANNNDNIVISNNAIISLTGAAADSALNLTAGDDIVFDTGRIVATDVGRTHTVTLLADNEGAGVADGDRGSITNAAGVAASVTTNHLQTQAADGIGSSSGDVDTFNGIALRTSIDSLSAMNTASRSIVIQETNGLAVEGTGLLNQAAGGSISVTVASGSLTANQAVAATGSGPITLTASSGTLSLANTVTTVSGNILLSGDQVNQGSSGLLQTAGVVSLTADSGDITMANGASTLGTSGVSLTATGTVRLGVIAGNQISVTADSDSSGSGSILDNTLAETANISTTGTATLSAAAGIGSSGAGDIDTTVQTIAATNTSAGGIFLHETSQLVIAGVGVRTQGGNGNIFIDVDAGNLVVNSVVTAHGSGSVSLNADAGSITLAAMVSSTSGSLSVTADSVTQNSGGNFGTGGAGTITLTADNGNITMADGTTTTSVNGTISYTATGNIALSSLVSTDAQIFVTADSNTNATGAITDNTAADNANLTTANTVTLTAAQGIGSGNNLHTNTNRLEATNTTAGSIEVTETASGADLAIGLVSNVSGDVTLRTDNGSITDSNGGSLNIVAVNASLTAVNGSIGSIGANVFLATFDPLEVSLSGNLVASAATGAVAVEGTIAGTVSISAVTGLLKSDGNLNVSSNVLTVTNLALIADADNNGAGTLTIGAVLSVAGDLRLQAADIVATDGTIDLSATRLAVQSRQAETLRTIVAVLDASMGNNLIVTNTGDLLLDDLNGDGSAVSVAGGASISASSPLTINADVTVSNSSSFIAGDSAGADDDLVVQNNAVVTLTGAAADAILTLLAGDDIIFDSGRVVATDAGRTHTVALMADNEGAGVIDGDRGSVTNAAGAAVTVTTNLLSASASDGIGSSSSDAGTFNGVALRTSVDDFVASNSASNDIVITEANGLDLSGTGVQTLGGNGAIQIAVSAGDLTTSSVVTANGSGDVVLNANAGTVNLGAVVSSTTGNLNITGNAINQNANVSTGGAGTISLTAGSGAITMADLTTTTTVDGTIDYSATGNVSLSQLVSTNGNVSVTAGAGASAVGAILDISASEVANISTGGSAVLTAETGIGSGAGAADVDVQVQSLSATNQTSGNIRLQSQNSLIIDGTGVRTLGGNGNIEIQVALSTLTVNSVVSANGSGTVNLTSSGVLTLNAAVSSSTGAITLSGGGVDQNLAGTISTGGAGTVNVVATGSADAAIEMQAGSSTTTVTGLISYVANGNVVLGSLASTSSNIVVTADSDLSNTGSITDAGVTSLQTSGNATLTASTGIVLMTNIGGLAATNRVLNNISINEANGLAIVGTGVRTLGGNGNVTITVANGNLSVNAVVSTHGSGTLSLEATQGTATISATLTSTTGSISVLGAGITQNSNISTGGSGQVTLDQSGDQMANPLNIVMADGSTTTTVDGRILYRTGNDVVLSRLISVNGNIFVEALLGDITETTAAETANLSTSGFVSFIATGVFGAAGAADIDTTIGSLRGTATNGTVFVQETNALIIDNSGISGGGTISIDVDAGNLTVNAPIQNNGSGNILLNVDAGSALIGGLVSSSTGGNITVTALTGSITDTLADTDAGTAGEQGINFQTTGILTLSAASGVGAINDADIDTSVGTLVASNSTSGNIVIQETNGLTIAGGGVQTLGGNGLISIDVDSGNLIIQSGVSAHGTGNVSLNADAGTITQGANVSSSTGQILITGDAVNQNANITTAGAGTISVSADNGNIDMADGTTTMSANGDIAYNASNSVALSQILSTNGNLSVTALAGAITDSLADTNGGAAGEQGVNLSTSNTLTLSAAQGIATTGDGDIDTTVGTLIATNTTSGDVFIQETNGLIIGGTGVRSLGGNGSLNVDVEAGNLQVNSVVTAHGSGNVNLNADAGSVTVNAVVSSTTGNVQTAGDVVNQNANIATGDGGNLAVIADNGSITMADGTTATTVNGTIDYSASLDVALSQLISTNGNISVTATAGVITENLADTNGGAPGEQGSNLITAGIVTLNAAQGIGAAGDNDIDTTIGSLAASNSTSGNIVIQETNGLIIAGGGVQTLGGNGLISIDVDSGNLNIQSGVLAHGTGNVTLSADAGTITQGANVSSATGQILITGDAVNQNANITTSGAGTIAVSADNGNIDMADGTTTTSANGDIAYNASNSVALSQILSTSGNLSVTALAGAITDSLADTNGGAAGEQGVNLSTSSTLTLSAAQGIGTTGDGDIDTTVGTLIATNSTSGDVFIQETNGLIIGGTGVRSLGGNGSLNVDVEAGNLQVNSVATAHGSGNVNLNADAGSVTVNAVVSSTTGNVQIAGDVVNQNANIATGGVGNLAVIADNGSITMADGATTTMVNGTIDYNASLNVALSQLISTNGNINVTATAGVITENLADTNGGAPGEQGSNLITAGIVTLNAAQGIGAAGDNDIDTTIGSLAASNSTSGNIVIQETNGLIIAGGGVQTLGGNGLISIDVDSGNLNIQSGVLAHGTGNVTLSADAGTITQGANVSSATGQILITGDAVNQNANITTSGAGTIAVSADNGNIDMADGTTTTSANGDIAYNASNSVALSQILSTSGNLSVTALAGAITDSLADTNGGAAGEQGVNLSTSSTLTLSAAQGIGTTGDGDIDTTVGTLIATNSTSGEVFVQETNGLIIGGTGIRSLGGNGSLNVDVEAGNLQVNSVATAHGSGNVNLNADAGSVTVNAVVSSTTGNVQIAGDVVNQNANIATGGGGNLAVIADNGSITMADGTTATTLNGTIDYSASVNVALSQLNSTGANINVTATTGAISDNLADTNGGTPGEQGSNLISAGLVTLNAAQGIGAAGDNDIDTTIGSLVASNSTSGNIVIQETNGLIIAGGGVQTLGGNGLISIDVDSGNLNIQSGVSAHGTGNVSLNADAGTITQGANVSSTTGQILITGDAINQNANITTSGAGTIAVNADNGNIDMADGTTTTSANGDIAYNASNSVALSQILSTNGSIAITADSDGSGAGAITDNTAAEAANIATGGPLVTLNAAGGIGGAGLADIDTSIPVLAAHNLLSSGGIFIENNAAITLSDVDTFNGAVSVVAQGDINAQDVASLTDLNSNDITLVSTSGSITLGAITSGSVGDVSITANDAILDDGVPATRVVADEAAFSAANGIGSGNAIQTTVTRIDAHNSTSGLIELQETDDVQIQRLLQDEAQDIRLIAGGSIEVVATGTGVIIDDASASNGNAQILLQSTSGSVTVQQIVRNDSGHVNAAITLDAIGQNSDVVINAAVTTQAGPITVLADDSIRFSSSGSLTANGTGNILLTANRTSTAGDSGDQILMNDGATIVANSGTITLTTSGTNSGNITLGSLQTGNATSGAVVVTTNNGAILDGGDAGVDITASAAGAEVTLTAANGIGSGNALETTVSFLRATNTVANSIGINQINGNLTLGAIANIGRDVDITAANGSIVDGNDSTLAAEAAAGQNEIVLTDASHVKVGDQVTVRDSDSPSEVFTVLAVTGNTLTLSGNLLSVFSPASGARAAATNVRAANASLTSNSGSIGATSADVFKGVFDTIEVSLTGNLIATAPAGSVAIYGTVGGTPSITATTGYLESAGDLNLSASTFTVTNLAIITSGRLTVADAGLAISGDLRIEANDVDAVTVGNSVQLGSAVTRTDRLLYEVTNAADETVVLFTDVLDVATNSSVKLSLNQNTQLADLNCDLTSIITNGNTAILNSNAGTITQGTANGTLANELNDRILTGNLLLKGDGAFVLDHADNNVDILAANTTNSIAYHDIDALTIGMIADLPPIPVVTINGIQTAGQNVLISTGGALTLTQQLDAGIADVRLIARGDITQSATGTISANLLGIRQASGSGDIILGDDNNVNVLAVENPAAAGRVTFHNTGNLTVGSVGLESVGQISFAAATGVTTNNADVLISADGALAIDQQIHVGIADVRLIANGNLTQSVTGTITADELGVRQQSVAGGNIALGDANDVNTLAIRNNFSGGSVVFNDTDALIVGALSAANVDGVIFAVTSGVTTNNGDILINADRTLTLNQQINSGTGDVRLIGNGDITQSAAGTIIADELGIRQRSTIAGDILLGDANNVSTVAASNATANGLVVFNNISDLIVSVITSQALDGITFAATSGVTTNNSDILINADGTLTLNQQINSGSADVRLIANGDITQSATGTIIADELGIRQQSAAGGNIALGDTNDVNSLAIRNDFNRGTVVFNDADGLTISAVSASTIVGVTFAATSGVTTNNGDVLINADGTLTLNQQINAGTTDVRLMADGDITQSFNGTITADELGIRQQSLVSGKVELGDANDVNSLSIRNDFNGGMVVFNDTDELIIDAFSGITVDGVAFAATSGVTTNDGDILINADGTLTLNQQINAGLADVRLIADGDITQSATGTIIADELGIRQQSLVGGNVELGDANDVNTLAVQNEFAAGTVVFNDADGLVVDALTAVTIDGVTFAATSGVTTNNGDILINADGTLTLNQQINAGTADVRLIADGNITQSATGTIIADELGVRQQSLVSGNVELGDANEVNTLAIRNNFSGGTVVFNDNDGLIVASVSAVTVDGVVFAATSGVSTNNGGILINADGALSLNQQVNAGTADVRLIANGDITQSANGTITADELGVRQQWDAGGNIALGDANDVNSLAIRNNFSGGSVVFNDTDGLIVGAVSAANFDGVIFAVTSGVTTNHGNILINADSSLTLNQQINSGTADVRLIGNGDITQSAAGTIIADELGIRQRSAIAGDILLGDANDVSTVTASNATANQLVVFNNVGDLIVGTVTSQALDGITFAATSGVTTNNSDILINAEGTLTLNQQINSGSADVRLIADGDITQSATGTIIADELGIRQQSVAGGHIALGDANNVNLLAIRNNFSGGSVVFNDTDALTVAALSAVTVDGVVFAATSGVTTSSGDILINADGTLTLNQQVNAGAAEVRLIADGDITQSAAGTIIADELSIRQQSLAGGSISLGDANDVNTLAIRNNFSGGSVVFNDTDALIVGALSAATIDGVTFAATSGITTNNGDILINADGTLTLNQEINAGTADVRLIADGNITQSTTGTIIADELGVRQQSVAGGNIELGDANDVNTLAIRNNFSGGAVVFNNTDSLIVAAVSGVSVDGVVFAATSGVTTNNGDILINANGTLTINQQINAGTADVRLIAEGDITQSAIGTIIADELGIRQQSLVGGIVELGDANDVNTLAIRNNFSGGTVVLNDIDALVVDSVSSATIDGVVFAFTSGVTTNNGDILINANGTLTNNQQISSGTADVRLMADGDINQSITGTIIADELGIRQQSTVGGSIVLGEANNVNTLAIRNGFSSGSVVFNDVDGLNIGAVSAASVDGVTFAATSGISTSNGVILINADGTLTINQQVNAGTADVRLIADGDITQSAAGTIIADELGVRQQSAAGDIELGDGNDVNTLAISNDSVGGTIVFNDTDELIVDAVSAATVDWVVFGTTAGVTTNNGDILINANGALTLNQQINAGTADVRLIASGNITQSATGTITADELGVRQQSTAGGNVELGDGNDVNTLAVRNNFSSGTVVFHDTDGLIIGAVSAASIDGVTFAAATGVSTNHGDILIDADAILTLNQQVNAGTADVRLIANGDISQTATGTITADELGVRQQSTTGGNVELGDANEVNSLAIRNYFSGGSAVFNDIDGLVINSVSAITVDGVAFANTTGVTTNNGNILLNADGRLTLSQQINAGTADVRLIADGDITQSTSGVIIADELGIRQQSVVGGNVELGDANDVNTVAVRNAFAVGTIVFNDVDDLTVGRVSNLSLDDLIFDVTTGLLTNNGDVLINADGALSVEQQINSGTASVRLVADGNISQTASGTILAAQLGVRQESSTGSILLGDNNNAGLFTARNLAVAGRIVFNDVDAVIVEAMAAQTIDGVTFATTSGVASNNSDVLLDANGALTINQQIQTGSADVRLIADGTVSQSSTGLITAASLGVRQESVAGGQVLLGDGNDVNELSIVNLAAGGRITFHDIDELTIANVASQSIDGVSFAASSGLSTNNGNILIDAGGALSLNQRITAGSADVRLLVTGDITQSTTGTIIADELGVRQQSTVGGHIELGDANDVNSVAIRNAFTTGHVVFSDLDDLRLSTVLAESSDGVVFAETTGVSTSDGDILLNTDGSLILNQQLNAGTADIRIIADGDISQTATGIVTGDQFGVRQQSTAGGHVLLSGNNDVNTLAVSNVFNGGSVTFTDVDGFTIGTVEGQIHDGVLFVETQGITLTNGNLRLNASGTSADLTIDQAINTGSGHITLLAGDDIDLNANIVTQGNQSTAGTVFLMAGNNTSNDAIRGVDMQNGTAILSGNGNVRIVADNESDIRLGLIDAGTGNVSLIAERSILDNNAAARNVQANTLRMIADAAVSNTANQTGFIGGSDSANGNANTNLNAIDTQINRLAAQSADGIYVLESNGLTIDATDTITVQQVTSSGTTVVVSDSALADLTTTDNGSIKIVAAAGSITVNDGDAGALHGNDQIGVRAHSAVDPGAVPSQGSILLEARGIAGDVMINATVQTWNGTLAGRGHITVTAGDDIHLNGRLLTSGSGSVLLTAADGTGNATTTVVDGINLNGTITVSGGDVLIRSARDIQQIAAITCTTGDIGLLAGRDLLQGNSGDISAASGDVLMEARRHWTMQTDTVITAGGGEFYGAAVTGDLNLGRINAVNAALSAGGNISDANETALNVTGTSVTFRAGNLIGSSDPTNGATLTNLNAIDTQVDTLAALAGTGIYIEDADSLTVDSVAAVSVAVADAAQVNFNSTTTPVPESRGTAILEDLTMTGVGEIRITTVSDSITLNRGTANLGGPLQNIAVYAPGGGKVSIQAATDIFVHGNIVTREEGVISSDPATDAIRLIARSGDIVIGDPSDLTREIMISTDHDEVNGSSDTTNDVVDLIARAGQVGNTTIGGKISILSPVTIRTDGGVAKKFGPRPDVGVASTAFFQYVSNPLPLAIDNSPAAWNTGNAYINAFSVLIGQAGEENLTVDIDWQDPSEEPEVYNDGTTQTVAGTLGIYNQISSERIQQFLVEKGGPSTPGPGNNTNGQIVVGHLYTALDYTRFQQQQNRTTIIIDLSVSHHSSINLSASSIAQSGVTQNVPGLDAASTDISTTVSDRGSATPDIFENGIASFKIPTVTPAPPALFTNNFVPGADRPFNVAPPENQAAVSGQSTAEFGSGAVGGSVFSTEVYFQIRRQYETDGPAEVVVERITDSSLISSREAFEKFVEQNPELQDGAGYEIWLISETGGQKVERPIVEFEISGGQPGTMNESVPEGSPVQKLQDLPFEQPAESDTPPQQQDPEIPQAGMDVAPAESELGQQLRNSDSNRVVSTLSESSAAQEETSAPSSDVLDSSSAALMGLMVRRFRKRQQESTVAQNAFSRAARFQRKHASPGTEFEVRGSTDV